MIGLRRKLSVSWKSIEKIQINSANELKSVIQKWQSKFGSSALVLLSGELGAGKTEFVKQWGALHGLDGIASPTFALHHSYGETQHYDLYRIESGDDLETVGLWEVLADRSGYIFIEWPERVPDSEWPNDWRTFKIQFTKMQGSVRVLELFERN